MLYSFVVLNYTATKELAAYIFEHRILSYC
jgi:hypothetical protein